MSQEEFKRQQCCLIFPMSHVKFKKRPCCMSLISHAEGGGQSFEVVLLKGGGTKSFHPLKGTGSRNVVPCLEGCGAQTVFDTQFSHFGVPPLLLVINDRSLSYIPRVKFKKCSCPNVNFKVLYPSGGELTLYWVNDL